jgi:hypothetical protein
MNKLFKFDPMGELYSEVANLARPSLYMKILRGVTQVRLT